MQKIKIKTVFPLIFLVGQFFVFDLARAQGGYEFLTSWKANSFVPFWYEGKVLPSRGSRLIVRFELLKNGKPSDLSGAVVRWYVNDNLVKNENDGLGIKSYSFIVANYPGNDIEIRIVLPDFKGQTLNKIIKIPVVDSEVEIESPAFSLNNISKNAFFKANPFFFNVKTMKNLSFEWLANGQSSGNYIGTNILNLSVDSVIRPGAEINLEVWVKNLLDEMQSANQQIQFRVK